MKNWDDIKCIVSLTSYGERLKILPVALKNVIELPEFHFVFTIYKGDVDKLTTKTKQWVDSGLLELFIDDIDYKFHKKYMHAMEKYGDKYPVLTIDDDCFYTPENLRNLYAAHLDTPNYVIGTRGCHMKVNDHGEFTSMKQWYPARPGSYGEDILLWGVGGIIYPPGFKPIFDFFPMYEVDDDVPLHAATLQQGLKIRTIGGASKEIHCPLTFRTATWVDRVAHELDRNWCNLYKDLFIKHINESVRTGESS